jgi:hypothetical protein
VRGRLLPGSRGVERDCTISFLYLIVRVQCALLMCLQACCCSQPSLLGVLSSAVCFLFVNLPRGRVKMPDIYTWWAKPERKQQRQWSGDLCNITPRTSLPREALCICCINASPSRFIASFLNSDTQSLLAEPRLHESAILERGPRVAMQLGPRNSSKQHWNGME